jgi:hypothetical protein
MVSQKSSVLSVAFVYNSLNGGIDQGLLLTDGLQFIHNAGAVPEDEMPYHDWDYLSKPGYRLQQMAQNYRLPEYVTL